LFSGSGVPLQTHKMRLFLTMKSNLKPLRGCQRRKPTLLSKNQTDSLKVG